MVRSLRCFAPAGSCQTNVHKNAIDVIAMTYGAGELSCARDSMIAQASLAIHAGAGIRSSAWHLAGPAPALVSRRDDKRFHD